MSYPFFLRFISIGISIFIMLPSHATAGAITQAVMTQATATCNPLNATSLYSAGVNIWNMDGVLGTNILTSTMTPTSGILSGSVVNTNGVGMTYVPGVISQAIKFGGDDRIDFGFSTATLTAYTVSFWVKPGTLATNSTLFGRTDTSQCFYNPNITLVSSTGSLVFQESGCGGTGGIAAVTISTTAWTHVALTRSGQTAKAYVNGVLIVTDTAQPSAIGSGAKLVIGAAFNSASGGSFLSFTDASIDEVLFWNGTTLSDTDIATLYNSQHCN